jgi:hypothetical protein
VKHGGDADAGAQVLGIGRDCERGLGRCLEQEIVDHGLVLVGDVGDRAWQREHHVEVRHGQQLGFALGEPFERTELSRLAVSQNFRGAQKSPGEKYFGTSAVVTAASGRKAAKSANIHGGSGIWRNPRSCCWLGSTLGYTMIKVR